jgi:superfamily II DNA or RNA helicase
MAKHWRFRPHHKVQIASAQTLERMESTPTVDIVFIDELHACLRASIQKMMDTRPTLRVVGATATPFHPAIGKYFSNVVSVTTMAKLVEQKFLVPFRVFVAKEIDTTGLKVVAGEWKKDDLEKRGQQIVGDVVADYIRISNQVFGGYRKTICFSCGIAHGAELAQKFNEAGINAVQISSEDDEDYRDEVLKDFAKPDSAIKVVISVAILSRGFDQSDVDYVILARPLKKSFSEHVQMVGRGARIHPGKEFCVIQDNSGNYLRFAEDWDKLYHEGVEQLGQGQDSKPKKEPTAAQKEAAKCPKCSVIWGGGDTCLNCGHVRVARNDVQVVAGQMVEIGMTKRPAAEKFTAEFKADFYAQLLGYAEEHNHKPGSAWWKYKDKFGIGPSMAKPEPVMPTQAVRNWITSQNIRKAKSLKQAVVA